MVSQMFVHTSNIFKRCDIKVEKTGAACGTNVGQKKCKWDINRLGGSRFFWLKTGTSDRLL